MSNFESQLPALTETVLAWLQQQGIEATGKPFLRYHVIDMPERMDVELGVPIAHMPDAPADKANDLNEDRLPAGRYATLSFTGVSNGITATQSLIDWIRF